MITNNDAIAQSYDNENQSIRLTIQPGTLNGTIFNTEAWARSYNTNHSINITLVLYDETTGDPYELYVDNGDLKIRTI